MWRVQRYLTHKQGIAAHECEDALACLERSRACAVADGATEAFGARHWARLLARSWVRCPQGADPAAFVELAARLGERAQKRWAARPLPWYAEEKRQQGSHAAFVGLVFEPGGSGLRWRALALGDCCLFQLRGDALLSAMPLSEPAQFGFRQERDAAVNEFLDLLGGGADAELAQLIAAQRQCGRMRNDDVAALLIELRP
jgi:hypothetical protein